MKNVKKSIAGLSAFALTMSLTACGGGSEGGSAEQTSDTTVTTTTAATVEINTATVAEEDQKTLDQVAEENLRDINKKYAPHF